MKSVYWYAPNVLGYGRIALCLAAFTMHAFGHWGWCAILYWMSFFFDYFDGYLAKRFNQASKFGGSLDMITDRWATAGLCLILSQIFPRWTPVFVLLIGIDFFSHYFLTYYSELQSSESHKDIGKQGGGGWMLRTYYNNRRFMIVVSTGGELFYLFLYLSYYTASGGTLWSLLSWNSWQVCTVICLPFFLMKQWANIEQLVMSTNGIVRIDQLARKEESQEPAISAEADQT